MTSFYLRGIVPADVLDKYQKGYFNRPIRDRIAPIKISQNATFVSKVYPADSSAGVFTFNDKYGTPVVIATTEHTHLRLFAKNGVRMGGRCDSCKDDFTTQVIGIPHEYENLSLLGPDNKYHIYHVYHITGEFCSFECALYWLLLINKKTELLHNMHKHYFPDADELKPTNNPRLRIKNGGSLTEDEWRDNKYTYLPNNAVIKNTYMIPLKEEYIRVNAPKKFQLKNNIFG